MRSVERIFLDRARQLQLGSYSVVAAQTVAQPLFCRRSSGYALSSQIRRSAFFCSDCAIRLQFEYVRVLFVKIKKMSDNVFRLVCNKKGVGIDVVD